MRVYGSSCCCPRYHHLVIAAVLVPNDPHRQARDLDAVHHNPPSQIALII